jgi:hypothetical protein
MRGSKRCLGVCPNIQRQVLPLLVTIFVLLISLPLIAQLNTGRISGAVTDQSGGVIAGATVSVVDVARGDTRPLTTDASGLYAAPNLTPGNFTIRAEAKGFQTYERQNVAVTAGSDVRVDVVLQPGAQSQTITVTEALPIINTTNAQTGGTLDNATLANLPINGRNYRWQSNFVPGVVVGVGEGSSNQSVNGTPLANGMWNFIFDGLYSETFFTLEPGAGGTGEGGDATLMPLDAIQEVQVVLNPKAEFGWAPGVTENMALKSGTNTMHGSAYAYGRTTALDAKNPITGTRPDVAFEQFGATLGGPIKKDKLFYFVGFEGERVSLQSSFLADSPTLADLGSDTANSIPDAIAAINSYNAAPIAGNPPVALNQLSLSLAGCDPGKITAGMTTGAQVVASGACNKNQFGSAGLFNNTSTNPNQPFNLPNSGGSNNGLAKLDYHLSDHHSLNGSFYIGRYAETLLPRNTQLLQQYWEELLGTQSDMGRLVEIWTPSASWLNEARVGVDHGSRPVVRAECAANGDFSNPQGTFSTAAAAVAAEGGSVGGVKGPNYLTAYGVNSGALGCGIPTITINGFTSTLGFGNNREDWENPIQGADSVSYTHGTHQFKFGMDIRSEHVTGAKVLDSQSGTVTFGSSGFSAFCTVSIAAATCPSGNQASALEDFIAGAVSSETIRANSPIRNITSNKIGVFVQDDWRVIPKLTLNLGFRWEAETPERDANGQIGTFIPGTLTGMVQNNTLFKFQSDYEPRFGFAYDLTGKGRTVVRGGFGVMYMIPQLQTFVAGGTGQDYGGEPTGATLIDAAGNCVQGNAASFQGNPLACAGAGAKPTVGNITSVLVAPQSATTQGVVNGGLTWNVSPATLFSPVAVCGNGLVPTGGGPKNPPTCTGVGGDPNLKLFPYYFWNLGVQHAFTNSVSMDVSYVGSHSSDVYQTFNINSPTPGTSGGSNEQIRRPFNSAGNNGYNVAYPWFATINYSGNFGSANYASLQTNLTLRNMHGLTVNANYTLSHALAQDTITNVLQPLQDYGNLAFDARDHFTLTASYAIPGFKSPGQILQGWAINGSANIMSPLPLDIVDGSGSRGTLDVAGTGGLARWTLFGPATPFNDILGGANTVPCYTLANTVIVNGQPQQQAVGKLGGAPCQLVQGTSKTDVSNFPSACLAAATLEPNGPSGAANTGLAQLAAIGCYAVGSSAIVPPAQGTFGNMTPNELRGKAFHLVNFSVTKEWKIKERLTTQFRWEIFNLLNQTQYGTIGVNLGQPHSFGLSQTTPDIEHGSPIVGSGGPREMQLALRFNF